MPCGKSLRFQPDILWKGNFFKSYFNFSRECNIIKRFFCNLKVETDPLNLILYWPLLHKIDERSKFLTLPRQITRAKSNSTIAGLQLGDYPCVHCCHVLPLSFAQSGHKVIIMNVVIVVIIIITTIMIVIIIITNGDSPSSYPPSSCTSYMSPVQAGHKIQHLSLTNE